MEEYQTKTWQQALEQGNANESLKLYRTTDGSDEGIEGVLESFTEVQTLLREKNPTKAKQVLSKQNKTLVWLEQLSHELTLQLTTLEEASNALDKHDPDTALAQLNNVTSPLLLAEGATLRGTALIYHNDTAGAKAAFERALQLDSNHYRAITNLGNIALESGNLDEAISNYEHALKLNENFANAHHNLAVAYRKKGMVSKSVSELKKAQRVSQQKLREEARQLFKGKQTTKYLRWLLMAAAAIILYLFIQQRTP
jgi:tetratricopeptide (TPR) repeat protein